MTPETRLGSQKSSGKFQCLETQGIFGATQSIQDQSGVAFLTSWVPNGAVGLMFVRMGR